jgi:hypothetical protein
MGSQFDCPTGDHGVCSVPDLALVLVVGQARLATSDEVDSFLGHPDKADEGRVKLVERLSDRERDALAGGLSPADRGGGPDHGVIATCTCSHVYILR